MPDGKVDFSGNWTPNAIQQNVDMVGSGVDVPFLPWAKQLYDKRKGDLSKDDPEGLCASRRAAHEHHALSMEHDPER